MEIPGRPRPYDRAVDAYNKSTGKTIRVHSADYRAWRSMAAQAVNLQRRGITYTEPVIATIVVNAGNLRINLAPAIPDTARPKGIRGDLDNYVKAALDSAQEGRWLKDDRLVVAVNAWFGDE